MQNCDCPLDSDGAKVGFFGSSTAKIIFVGESPGRQEEIQGKPFIGRSGQLLRGAIKDAGIKPTAFCFANSARCLVDTNKLTKREVRDIIKRCRHFVADLITKVRPQLIVPVGDIALYQILRKEKITKHRGRLYWSDEFGCWCYPILHPAGVLRDQSRLAVFQSDLSVIAAFLNSGFDPKSITGEVTIEDPVAYFNEIRKEAAQGPVRVAFDTETTGLDPLTSQVIGFSFSAHPGRGAFCWLLEAEEVPVKENLFEKRWEYSKPRSEISQEMKILRFLLDNDNIELIMQHGSFDLRHLHQLLGYPVNKNYKFELQAAAHLLDEERFRIPSLDTLNDAFGTYVSSWKDFVGQVFELDPTSLEKYAVEDAVRTLDIGECLRRHIYREQVLGRYFEEVAMPALREALLSLEMNGVGVDVGAIPDLRFTVLNKLESVEQKVIRLLPVDVIEKHKSNLSLTRKDIIRDYIFSSGKVPRAMTEKGGLSVNKNFLAGLLYLDSTPYAIKHFIKTYLKWVEWNGLLNRSIAQIEEFVGADGRVHSNYTICGAVTGRVASSRPNLMNIVARGEAAGMIKGLIKASPGYVLLEADYSQAELRWIAHISGDETMQGVYLRGEDIHTNTAKALAKDYDNLPDSDKKSVRTKAKGANFGIVYGIGPHGLKKFTLQAYGQVISLEESQGIIDNWFREYPGVKRWQEESERFVNYHGYIDSPLGRRRHVTNIHLLSKNDRGRAVRQAINAPIQSASSDTALLTLVEILRDKDLTTDIVRPILFVHDSLTFEVKEEYLEDVKNRIRQHMVNPPLHRFGITFAIPFEVDMAFGISKNEMVELK